MLAFYIERPDHSQVHTLDVIVHSIIANNALCRTSRLKIHLFLPIILQGNESFPQGIQGRLNPIRQVQLA